jgi:Na+/melibiose symporter-like transporter
MGVGFLYLASHSGTMRRHPEERRTLNRIIAAVLLSFLCPGLGQYYNRQRRKGSVIVVLTTLMILLPSIWIVRNVRSMLPDPKEGISPEAVQFIAARIVTENKHLLNLVSFSFLGVWAYAITQAYFKAKEISEIDKPKGEGQ